jgi:hypothetical protein
MAKTAMVPVLYQPLIQAPIQVRGNAMPFRLSRISIKNALVLTGWANFRMLGASEAIHYD